MADRRHAAGSDLKDVFDRYNPFSPELELKPESERRTVLAVNGNFPFELELAGFYHASATDGGSPIIVQFSSSALATAGRGLRDKADLVGSLRAGARMATSIAQFYASIYESPFAALGLDHYAVPNLHDALFKESKPLRKDVFCPPKGEIRSLLAEAVEAARSCGVKPSSREDVAVWETYLCSFEYREAVAGFMAVIEEMKPAWAMIDTEDLPGPLNFAVTKEICDLVSFSGSDAMVEAEYGSTGQAGEDGEYRSLKGDAEREFARQVAGFVRYTGAEGISYPIGMEHAAPSAVKHEPDLLRLEAVQREILRLTGRYVPFAQHGGTGARSVARGLVAKDNVNTLFLVTAAQYFAQHTEKNREAISQGRKSAASASMYLSAARTIAEATVRKLKECGTYGILGRPLQKHEDGTTVSARAE